MPKDNRLDLIHELQAKNWELTFDVELQKQNVRRLNEMLQDESLEASGLVDEVVQKENQLLESEKKREMLEERVHALEAMMKQEHATLSRQADQLQTANCAEKHRADAAESALSDLLLEKETLHQQLLELRQAQITHEEATRTLQAAINEQKNRADIAEASLLEVKAELVECKKKMEEVEREDEQRRQLRQSPKDAKVLQGRLNEMFVQHVERGTQQESNEGISKKRKKQTQDQLSKNSNLIKEFILNHTEANIDNKDSFLSTKKLFESFQQNYKDQQPQDFNILHFAADLSKHVQDINPSARHSRNNSNKGYVGFQLK